MDEVRLASSNSWVVALMADSWGFTEQSVLACCYNVVMVLNAHYVSASTLLSGTCPSLCDGSVYRVLVVIQLIQPPDRVGCWLSFS
jgi:hypothetical protein